MTKTLKELLAERAQLDVQIATTRKDAAKEALANVLELVNEFGFTAQQVFPWKPVVKKSRPSIWTRKQEQRGPVEASRRLGLSARTARTSLQNAHRHRMGLI